MNFPKFLKVAAITLVRRNKTTNEVVRYINSLDYKTTDAYATALGFKYEMVPSLDGEFGRKLSNGSFTGAIGLVHRGEADISICAGISDERIEAVDFNYPYLIDSYSYVTRHPDFSPKFLTFVYPFSMKMWICILVCLIAISLVFYALYRKKLSYQTVLLNVFGSFLNQSSIFHSERMSRRWIFLTWTVGTMIIIYSYTAVLLSFLTLPIRERGIRTIPDLAEAVADGRYQSSTFIGTLLPNVLLKAEEPLMRVLGANLKKNLVNFSDTEATVLRSNTKVALLSPRSYVAYLESRCFISKDNFFLTLIAVSYNKSFCCPRQLETATHRIVHAGLFHKFMADQNFLAALKLPIETVEVSHALSMVDMSGAFSFLILGYILSLVVFVTELLLGKV